MKVALIHGYGIGFNKKPPFGKIIKILGEENVKVFRWEEKFTHPADTLSRETKKALEPVTHKLLHDFLIEYQPDVVLGHSLGSFLLFHYLKENNFPKSVKKLVFVQGILSRNLKIENKKFTILNYFCPWDPTLWAGAVLHKVLPIGLFGSADQEIKNIMYPLQRLPNLHTSTINDERFILSLTH